jgi:hypothetical protein
VIPHAPEVGLTSKECNPRCEWHYLGRHTIQNLFHAVNDNILPLFAQIVLDGWLFPDYLYGERVILTGHHQPVKDSQGVPHFQLLKDAIPESMTLQVDCENYDKQSVHLSHIIYIH